jgi:hypothetical protein
MAADLDAVLEQDRDIFAVELVQSRIRIYVNLGKRDPEGPQGHSHLFT